MRSVIPRALILACSTLLVLPPGWCCLLGRGYCCGPRPTAGCSCAAKTAEASACYCREKSGPPRQPPAPAKARCCERDLTVGTKVERPSSDAALAGPSAAASLLSEFAASSVTLLVTSSLSSPRLHLLHCVWLC